MHALWKRSPSPSRPGPDRQEQRRPWADDPAGWPFVRASEILGWDVIEVLESGDAALSDTRKAQPAIYVHSAACHLLAREEGLRPDLVAGLLGEYAALFAAGGSATSRAWLVVRRAELAHQAGGAGVMRVVLGLPDKTVGQLLPHRPAPGRQGVPGQLQRPGQVVISGESEAVEETARRALAAGAKRVLASPIGGGFHALMTRPAALQGRAGPDRPDPARGPAGLQRQGQVVRSGRQAGRLLARQLTNPVHWTSCVSASASSAPPATSSSARARSSRA